MQRKRAEDTVRMRLESEQNPEHLSRSHPRPAARDEISEEAFRSMLDRSIEQNETGQTESAEAFFERLDQMF